MWRERSRSIEVGNDRWDFIVLFWHCIPCLTLVSQKQIWRDFPGILNEHWTRAGDYRTAD